MSTSPSRQIRDLCQGLQLNDDMLKIYMQVFKKELKAGLRKDVRNVSPMKCLMTYFQDLPTGNERGSYLVLSVPGIVIKVLFITLKRNSFDLRSKQYTIPLETITSTSEKLFDFFAQCTYEFCVKNNINKKHIPLSFSFGFPCEQRSVNSSILVEWTKGFNCPDAVGQDVRLLLERSLAKIKDLDTYVSAVINDALGALLSAAWKASMCHIGMVIDTGTNICYLESIKNIGNFDGNNQKPDMIINTEYGNLGSNGQIDFVRTGWDKDLDESTVNPGRNVCEKMISSLYLGEIVRRILMTAINRGIILGGKLSADIGIIGSFDISHLLDIIRNQAGQRAVRNVLNKLGYAAPWTQDCVDVEYVCATVCQRSSIMAAASIAAVVSYLGFSTTYIGLEGIFCQEDSDYTQVVKQKIRDLTDPDQQFKCVFIEDGGGLGAALAACIGSLEFPHSRRVSLSNIRDSFVGSYEIEILKAKIHADNLEGNNKRKKRITKSHSLKTMNPKIFDETSGSTSDVSSTGKSKTEANATVARKSDLASDRKGSNKMTPSESNESTSSKLGNSKKIGGTGNIAKRKSEATRAEDRSTSIASRGRKSGNNWGRKTSEKIMEKQINSTGKDTEDVKMSDKPEEAAKARLSKGQGSPSVLKNSKNATRKDDNQERMFKEDRKSDVSLRRKDKPTMKLKDKGSISSRQMPPEARKSKINSEERLISETKIQKENSENPGYDEKKSTTIGERQDKGKVENTKKMNTSEVPMENKMENEEYGTNVSEKNNEKETKSKNTPESKKSQQLQRKSESNPSQPKRSIGKMKRTSETKANDSTKEILPRRSQTVKRESDIPIKSESGNNQEKEEIVKEDPKLNEVKANKSGSISAKNRTSRSRSQMKSPQSTPGQAKSSKARTTKISLAEATSSKSTNAETKQSKTTSSETNKSGQDPNSQITATQSQSP